MPSSSLISIAISPITPFSSHAACLVARHYDSNTGRNDFTIELDTNQIPACSTGSATRLRTLPGTICIKQC